ncbi:MAG: thiamine pyrophosphate-binding protein [Elusimicrobiota bacterium]
MKLSDYVIDFIVKEKVGHVFEMVGGMITHLLDSVHGRKDIICVSMHHEQAAAFAAEGYARINGRLGVAMATSGPGALNMLTPIGSCYFDSVPCLFITGQVNTYEYKFERPVRQIGFQETDIVSVVKPLVKYAEMVGDASRIRYCLEKAVFLAQSGRPGPVLLDIPMDIQRSEINPKKLKGFFGSPEHKRLLKIHALPPSVIARIVKLISSAKRPVILAGGGVRTSGATSELEVLVKQTGIPVVTSLMGLDSFAHDDPSFSGMIGAYGNRYANLALANSDLLLILGSRLDNRQTGTKPGTFARGAVKIHVDIDPVELNAKVKADIALNCDVRVFLEALNSALNARPREALAPWHKVIESCRLRYPASESKNPGGDIQPNNFMDFLSSRAKSSDIVCLDVGQNQMWAAQSYKVKKGQRMLVSGGMGSMGFSMPAAIGAVLAAPGRRALAICGDGGIQVNIQDMDALVKLRLPIKLIIMNNGCLGMVRQFQDIYFGGRRQSTEIGYHCPDIKKIAVAYGLKVYTISSMSQAGKVLDSALKYNGPVLIDVKLGANTTVDPKLTVNCPIEDMSPHLSREALEREMIMKSSPAKRKI